jgi:hypothetical protein
VPVRDLVRAATAATVDYKPADIRELLREPVIVLSAPRSGSTLLFEQLAALPGIWSIGGESHGVFRAFPGLRAENERLDSGCLDAAHADEGTAEAFRRCIAFLLRNHFGQPWIGIGREHRPKHVTLVEKTPRNALNVPFLRRVFPDARFVYLYRDARATIASLVEAWRVGLETGRFVTYRDLPGWDRPAWCFLLPRGWQQQVGKTLFEIATFQWTACTEKLLDDLREIDDSRCAAVRYEDLVADPGPTVQRLARFAGLDYSAPSANSRSLPLSRTTLSPPHPDKWRRWEREIEALAGSINDTERRVHRAAKRWLR